MYFIIYRVIRDASYDLMIIKMDMGINFSFIDNFSLYHFTRNTYSFSARNTNMGVSIFFPIRPDI